MLLDTSGLLCLYHRAEPLHEQARIAYQSASFRFTHSYVLAEFVALANARRLPRLDSLSFLTDLVNNPDIEMLWVGEEIHQAAMTLLFARPDKAYSLCDAVSFVLMRRRSILRALTTDRHFVQEGFERLLVASE